MRFSAIVVGLVLCEAVSAQSPPNVLLIGDSISFGYAPYVIKALGSGAHVEKLPENGAHTRNGLAKVDNWLGSTKWSVIHFNWGLHDLVEGGTAVPLEEYSANLEKLVERLEKTGAKLIFATTTPVPEKNARKRRNDDVVRYNESAKAIMKKHNIPVNDLYAAAQGNLAAWQLPDNVHFNAKGSAGLGDRVVDAIREAMK